MSGPLQGLRVIEMAGIGPAPFCGMLLADMGAEVIRIDRLTSSGLGVEFPSRFDLLNRNKRSLAIDLKDAAGIVAVSAMIDRADAVIEGFRPGVMEKLGLGPEAFAESNPRLVFGRMTGWGQDGPLARAAGHDINFIAITGALNAVGAADGPPIVPLNLFGDFGGGTLYLAMGILAALIEAQRSGRGQVVDAAIVDGVSNLLTMHHALLQMGDWQLERASNLSDGGAPFYAVYPTADDRYVAVGAVEPKFYRELVARMGFADTDLPPQYDRSQWPTLRTRFAARFLEKSQAEWCAILEATDACFSPVLSFAEASGHPHNIARETLVSFEGVTNPAPAPRFSRTPGTLRQPPTPPGADSEAILRDWGVSADDIAQLSDRGAILPREK
jgi:alpha-methylacyl-CoA racemase